MDNLAGQQIKGYELQERIAAGGFGAVYRARQSTVGREVAIKVILPSLANKPDFIRRFEAEAQIVARLEHHFIVPLYDYWRDPDGAYLVMRYLKGGSLQDYIRTQGVLNIEEAVHLMSQITAGLHIAHRSQVIHRDIKPGNILLDEDGTGFLADFGIAKDHTTTENVTEADSFLGSPEYLAPEQARSEPVTPRTDIYSLGVVLYEMLTGQHPFPGIDNKIGYIFKHLEDALPEIDTLDQRIRADVNDVIQKATAKDPQQRFSDVIEMMNAFQQATQLEVMPTPTSPVQLLTPREQEVVQLIIDGKSNREIADLLVLTEGTIKTYITRIYRKLRVRSRVQAIARLRDLNFLIKKPEVDAVTVLPSNLPEPENPYKGLQAFQAADAQHFFGREKLIAKLLKRLQEDTIYKRFLSIVGPSGSGKSSVVKAGLIPALWRGDIPGSDNWYIVDMLPGAHPIDELEVALFQVASDKSINLREQLERDSRGLIRIADMILPDDGSELLIVIDQFEEVFTLLENEESRIHFLQLLKEAVTDRRSRVRILLTLRADYYDKPLQYPDFGELMRTRIETVLPLGAEELEQVIHEPAQRVSVKFDDGLVSRIVSDVHYQPGALPLLQYALTELFERRDGRTLTQQAYQDIGGTGGALANRADELFHEGSEAHQELIRQMFLRLVTLGEGAEDTRRRVDRSELLDIASDREMMDEVIDVYADSRLLSLDNDPATRRPTVEVAHEAILREWERLRTWLNDSRDDIRQERDLARATEDWNSHNRDSSYLLRGARLEQVEAWQHETQLTLTPIEKLFIETSLLQREAQAQEEAQRVEYETQLERSAFNRLRYAVGIFAIATVVGLILAGIAFIARNDAVESAFEAEQAADESLSVALAVSAQQAFDNDEHDLALALAIEANKMTDNPLPEVRRALVDIAYAPGLRSIWRQDSIRLIASAMSPDGRYLVTGEGGRIIYIEGKIPVVSLWDVSTGEEIRFFGDDSARHTATVFDAAFTPDSRRVVTAGVNNEAFLWDVETGEMLQQYQLPDEGYFAQIEISPDGRVLLASVCQEGHPATGCPGSFAISTWDIETGDLLTSYYDNLTSTSLLAFSPDGQSFFARIVTRENDVRNESIVRYDISTNQELFSSVSLRISSLALSPNGQMLAIGDTVNQIYLLDTTSGEQVRQFATSLINNQIYWLDFSHDGQTVISGSDDGLLRIWDVAAGLEIERFRGHSAPVTRVFYSPDSRQIVSQASNGDLMLWDSMPGNHRASYALEGVDAIWELAPLSDGERVLLTTGNPGLSQYVEDEEYLILMNIVTGEETWRSSVVGEALWAMDLSPDEAMAVTVSRNPAEPVRIWNMETGEEIRQFEVGAVDPVSGVTFTLDSRHVLIPSNGIIHLFDIESGYEIRRFINGGIVAQMAMSSDGRLMASADWEINAVKVWNFETGELLQTFREHTNGVMNVSFLPGDRRVISGGLDGTMRIHDVVSGEQVRFFEGVGPAGQTWSILNQDRDLALFTTPENNVVLLNIETGDEQAQFLGFSDGTQATFSHDSQTVITSAWDGVLHIWDVPPTDSGEVIAWVEANRLLRDLTAEECIRFRLCETPVIPAPVDTGIVLSASPSATPVYLISTVQEAVIGENRGSIKPGEFVGSAEGTSKIEPGDYDVWRYEGQAGEILTINVIADHPATETSGGESNAVQNELLDSWLRIYAPDGQFLIQNDNIGQLVVQNDPTGSESRNSRLENLELPADGAYRIEVSGMWYYTGGDYTLVIESDRG